MTKQDPLKFEELNEERITCIFSDSLWNNQAWLKAESNTQLSEQCNGHRMYVHHTHPLLEAKHDGTRRKCKELKDEVFMQCCRL